MRMRKMRVEGWIRSVRDVRWHVVIFRCGESRAARLLLQQSTAFHAEPKNHQITRKTSIKSAFCDTRKKERERKYTIAEC